MGMSLGAPLGRPRATVRDNRPMTSALNDPAALELLSLDVPARLATLDPDGFPRITPIWFLWERGAFYMTSLAHYPQVRNLRANGRASICIDTEEAKSHNGIRANRQIRATAHAHCFPDDGGEWTRRITLKYLPGPDGPARAEIRAAQERMVICLRPDPSRLIVYT